MRHSLVLFLSLVVSCVSHPRSIWAEDKADPAHYYMAIFSSQRDPNQARFAHTFATFVKATPRDGKVGDDQIETVTISWMPATLNVVLLSREAEPGTNLDLAGSLALAQKVGARVSMWGPYQIHKDLYDRAVAQEARLRNREIQYKALDAGFRPRVACSCIHAVSDLDADNGFLDTGSSSGEAASQLVANHLSRWIIQPEKVESWVRTKLGLADYPLTLHTVGR